MEPYEVIDHTADVALKIYGKDLKELFINAARGLFSFIVDINTVTSKDRIIIKLSADDVEELLVTWLNEFIFHFSAREFIPKEFNILKIDTTILEAEISGEWLDPKKHKILTEIKAATYHELKVSKIEQGWQARVIFDT